MFSLYFISLYVSAGVLVFLIPPCFSTVPYFVASNRIRPNAICAFGKKNNKKISEYAQISCWSPMAFCRCLWHLGSSCNVFPSKYHFHSLLVCDSRHFWTASLHKPQICLSQTVSVITASNLLCGAGLFKTAMNWKLFCYLFSMPDGTGISAISSGFGAKCDWHICISYPVNFIPGLFRYIKPQDAHHISSFPSKRDRKTILLTLESLAIAAPPIRPASPHRSSCNQEIASFFMSTNITQTKTILSKIQP